MIRLLQRNLCALSHIGRRRDTPLRTAGGLHRLLQPADSPSSCRMRHDHEVNLKAELDIMLLRDQVDLLREGRWGKPLAAQKERLKLPGSLLDEEGAAR